jgi:adenylate kinase
MIIILLGPPGSGKSTQGKFLSEELKIPSISMGKVLRDAQNAKTLMGNEAGKYMEEGKLVPTGMIQALTRFRLEEKDCKNGFILDGAPRKVKEAVVLDNYLEKRGLKIDRVFLINVSDDEVIRRLLKRASLPKEQGGGRKDDNIDDIRIRLNEYREHGDPLKLYYNQRNVLKIIDGRGTPEEVFKRICGDLQL